jgi:hypothetical protein
MGVSAELHAPVALVSGKTPRSPLNKWLAKVSTWSRCLPEQKILASQGTQTTFPRMSSLHPGLNQLITFIVSRQIYISIQSNMKVL